MTNWQKWQAAIRAADERERRRSLFDKNREADRKMAELSLALVHELAA